MIRWFVWVRRWAVGVRMGRIYVHLRRPDSPKLYSERYPVKCWCGEAMGWRLTVKWGLT